MRRRSELHGLLLLSTLWAWLTFVVACGSVMPHYARQQVGTPGAAAESCCSHSPTNDPCAADACGLLCATLFTVALSEHRVEVAPPAGAEALVAQHEFAEAFSIEPPVPPPRAA